MTHSEALNQVKAFAGVYGYVVLRGVGLKSNTYTLALRTKSMDLPCCPYMEPHELMIWIDGFLAGQKVQSTSGAKE